jgi:hypothetical protein
VADALQHDGLNDRATFERRLSERFPAVADEFTNIEHGILHLEMAAFARATCRAIEQDVPGEVRAHFEFIDELFSSATPDLENAIYVSYLENVFLDRSGDPYLSARGRLSPKLQKALIELEEHWEQIEKNYQERNPPKTS